MRTVIGIPASVGADKASSVLWNYIKAIETAGGLPLIIPYVEDTSILEEYLSLCNGILFAGGVDIEPKLYGEEKKPTCGEIQPLRDKLELALFELFFKAKKPILGICRGAQLINVALGGTLYQDLPTETASDICHRQTCGEFEFSHGVTVLSDTPLSKLFGKDKIRANSFHHQAVKMPGDKLAVCALADDGTAEALYYTGDRYIRAYQWHPERLFEKDADNRLVFDDFIKTCREAQQ